MQSYVSLQGVSIKNYIVGLEAVHGSHVDALHVVFESFDNIRDIFDTNL